MRTCIPLWNGMETLYPTIHSGVRETSSFILKVQLPPLNTFPIPTPLDRAITHIQVYFIVVQTTVLWDFQLVLPMTQPSLRRETSHLASLWNYWEMARNQQTWLPHQVAKTHGTSSHMISVMSSPCQAHQSDLSSEQQLTSHKELVLWNSLSMITLVTKLCHQSSHSN